MKPDILVKEDDRMHCSIGEALAPAERDLSQIVGALPVLIWVAQPDGPATFVNQHYVDYVGMPSEDLLGWGFIAAVHPDDLTHLTREWRRILLSGRPGELEARLRRFDGEYRWFLFRGSPLVDENGRVVKWYGVNIDIEDKKRAEELQKASEAQLCQIINAIPAMAWSADTNGNVEFLNRNFVDYVGVPLERLRGWGWRASVHPDDLQYLVETWKTVMASGQPGEAEARLRRFDGAYCWFLMRVSPYHDEFGKVIKWYGVNTDIEELKRAEAALRASELNLRRQTETIPQMLWSATPDGAIDYCNVRLLEYSGLTSDTALRKGWSDLLHPDDREAAARAWRHCIRTGEPYTVEVRQLHAADRTYRWVLTMALPLRDEDGRILKWYGACTDLHDWKGAQDELRQTQAELAHVTRVMTMGQLTASIAHELNQPLSGIMTNAGTGLRMLAADPPNVDGAMETARRMIRDARRASEVIDRLRALFARRTPATEIVDLNAAVQEIVALLSSELQKKKANCRLSLAEDLPRTMGDRIQLQQVIVNFMLNGVEAMEGLASPKELLVSTSAGEDGNVILSVKDRGIGFDSAASGMLFTPFYTTKYNGMGIGLSVSRTIVENHQGRIWAERNDDEGSTFSFSIPSLKADADAPAR